MDAQRCSTHTQIRIAKMTNKTAYACGMIGYALCFACKRHYTRSHTCWRCRQRADYQSVLLDRQGKEKTPHGFLTHPERLARIAKYTQRAAQELPLFDA